MSGQEPEFLHALLLDGAGGARRVDTEQLGAWSPSNGVLWIHIDVNDETSRLWLTDAAGLDEAVVDALLAGESRPWTSVTEGTLTANLRGVNTDPAADPEDMVSVRVWTDGHRVISSRRRRLLSIVDIVDALRAGRGPSTACELFAVLVERLSDRIGEFVDSIEERVDRAEEAAGAGDAGALAPDLADLRRQIAAVRRFLSPQRDALDRLNRRHPDMLTPQDSLALVQEADRVTRYVEDLDLAREEVVVLQEELLSRLAQQQNSRMYVLSIVAAVFLPLTFITGVLGMNVGGLPGLENPRAFAVSVVVMLGAGAITLLYFRFRGWL